MEKGQKLSMLWTKHLRTPEEKKDFTDSVHRSSFVLKVLRDILEEKIQTAEAVRESKDKYHLGAWAYYQADVNGTIRTLKEVVDLLPKE